MTAMFHPDGFWVDENARVVTFTLVCSRCRDWRTVCRAPLLQPWLCCQCRHATSEKKPKPMTAETPLEQAEFFIWYEIRDEIAENVPGYDTLTGIEVAELCYAIIGRAKLRPCTHQDLLELRNKFLQTREIG